MQVPEKLLPHDLLDRATLRGREYAWLIDDIPEVIAAARAANLVSIGGQLQFRFPDGPSCECYWVEVDTYQAVPADLPWTERVIRTAEVALYGFQQLRTKYDFVREGRSSFPEAFENWEVTGGDPKAVAYFVWYVITLTNEAETAAAVSSPSIRTKIMTLFSGRLFWRKGKRDTGSRPG